MQITMPLNFSLQVNQMFTFQSYLGLDDHNMDM